MLVEKCLCQLVTERTWRADLMGSTKSLLQPPCDPIFSFPKGHTEMAEAPGEGRASAPGQLLVLADSGAGGRSAGARKPWAHSTQPGEPPSPLEEMLSRAVR